MTKNVLEIDIHNMQRRYENAARPAMAERMRGGRRSSGDRVNQDQEKKVFYMYKSYERTP